MVQQAGRRRRSLESTRPRPSPKTTHAAAQPSLLQRIESLVAENAALRSDNATLVEEVHTLQASFKQIERALGPSPRRLSGGSANPRTALRRRRQSKPITRRARKPITDPLVLEKRRAALDKARKVLAAKRAASKAA